MGVRKHSKKEEKVKSRKRSIKSKKIMSRKEKAEPEKVVTYTTYPPSDCREFLQNAVDQLGWQTTGREVAMDIGCGFGDSTAILLEVCPRLRRVVAIDNSAARISQARRSGPCAKVEYRVANIEDRSTLVEWRGRMSKIVSIYWFNCINDTEQGFRNLHYLLRPGGEASIIIMLKADAFYDLIAGVAGHEIWGKHVMEEQIPKCSAAECRNHVAACVRHHLEKFGFEIVKCEVEQKTHTYDSDEELKNMLFQHFNKAVSLPSCWRQEFMDYLFKRYMDLTKQEEGGRWMVNNCLELLIRRLI